MCLCVSTVMDRAISLLKTLGVAAIAALAIVFSQAKFASAASAAVSLEHTDRVPPLPVLAEEIGAEAFNIFAGVSGALSARQTTRVRATAA